MSHSRPAGPPLMTSHLIVAGLLYLEGRGQTPRFQNRLTPLNGWANRPNGKARLPLGLLLRGRLLEIEARLGGGIIMEFMVT